MLFSVLLKDEEPELEKTHSETVENENATNKNILKLLQELKKEYDISTDKINCSNVNSSFGKLLEYCNMYENDIQSAISNMRSFIEKEVKGLNEKGAVNSKIDYGGMKNKNGFIEPDIDNYIPKGDTSDDPVPAKKMKLNVHFENFEEKLVPIMREVKDEIVSAIMGASTFGINTTETK